MSTKEVNAFLPLENTLCREFVFTLGAGGYSSTLGRRKDSLQKGSFNVSYLILSLKKEKK